MNGYIWLRKSHLLIASGCFGLSTPALSQVVQADVENPPKISEATSSGNKTEMLMAAPSGLPNDRVLDLKVVYTNGRLYNPATGKFDQVSLRSYNGTDVSPTAPYVSPTIEIVPGQTVRVNLDNRLPADPSCNEAHDKSVNTPHCYNGTNLHTHGLWVNPAGNGDNVLLSINPGVKFQYEYGVPSDHPSGTFWYHTHRHGSTALQVSSGMAGALIIRGDRVPTASRNGDIDVLTRGLKERVIVFQQIQYACRTAPKPGKPYGDIKKNPNDTYRCDPGDTGVIADYDQFGPDSWPKSGRYTSINGNVLPTFQAVQGQVERWRMIHAGVRDTITLKFVEAKPGAFRRGLPLLKSNADQETAIASNCTDKVLPYTVMAADGLTMAQGANTDVVTFQPGYRWDALVVFPKATNIGAAADYCVIDASAPASAVLPGGSTSRQLLGFVNITPGAAVPDPRARVAQALLANAQAASIDPAVKAAVIDDLKSGLKFSRFVPHPDVAASEVTGTQELTFFIDTNNGVKFEVGNTLQTADAKPYDPSRIDRKLILGGVDEWTLQSHFVSHPFHIHVNPFQVVSITDPSGKDVSLPGAIDNPGPNFGLDPQYAGLKGVWKDTLFIKSLIGFGPPLPPGSNGIYTVKVRTRYQRYIGEYVLHCHILDHEDQGMMQNVAVVLPGNGTSSLQSGSGHH